MEQNLASRNKLLHLRSFFDKSAKTDQWEKEQSFQQMVLEQLAIFSIGKKETST